MADLQKKSAQLFDKDNVNSVNAYFNSNNPSLITSDNAKCIYIQCEPNTTYTVNKAVSSRFFVGSCETEPQVGTVVHNTVGGNDWQGYLTITTGNSDLYLVAFVYRTQDTMTFAELCGTIMINKGSVALPWQPYSSTGWHHSLRKLTTATDTFTTLPADIYADGNNATVGISGNTVQSGTPTPSSPIQPQECGERTGNLFDIDNITHETLNADGSIRYESAMNLSGLIRVDGDYTVSWSAIRSGAYMRVSTYDDNKNFIARIAEPNTYTRSSYSNTHTGYIRINYENTFQLSDVQVNTGSTALPYEPYGYKIPISSASTTTPVYLGEVQTTRRIKKLVLTGQEDWSEISRASGYRFVLTLSPSAMASDTTVGVKSYCSHLRLGSSGETYTANNAYTIASNSKLVATLGSNDGLADWEQYLATQYAAGTPVTVWYVLATEETGIVNEPLMKIGDYADTVSGITIPTITGKDTFDVDTTLKPSEVSLSYTGWHDATVEEWDGSQWQ